MKHIYQINEISCGGCVTRVKKILEAHPDIVKTEIFLHLKGATIISMQERLSVEELQQQLDQLEGYTIEVLN